MKRVIHVVPSLSNGGAEKVALSISQHQVQHFEVHVITWLDDNEQLKIPGITHHKISGRGKRIRKFLVLVKELNQVFKSLRPSAVFSHLSYTNVVTYFASIGKPFRESTWYVHHSTSFLESKLENFFVKTIYRKSKIIAISEDAANLLRINGARNVIVAPNPLSLPRASKSLDKWDPSKTLEIIAVGRIAPEKNYRLMISSLDSLKVPYSLQIFGSDNTGHHLDSLKLLAANKNVEFRGNVEFTELCSEISEAHVFLMTSDFEGEPSSLLEAAAIGLPVVGRNTPGLGSAVKKVGGFLPFDDQDSDSIAAAIMVAAESGANQIPRKAWAGLHDKNFASHVYCEFIQSETKLA